MRIVRGVTIFRAAHEIKSGPCHERPKEDDPAYPPRRAFVDKMAARIAAGRDLRTGRRLAKRAIREIEQQTKPTKAKEMS